MGRGSRAILVGIDRSADEWSRIVVHFFDEGVSGELVASHRFEVGELAPDVVSSASRRLDAVAEALAEQSRAEHGYR